MNENQYSLAGWLAIAQAVLFPLAIAIGIAQGIIGMAVFHYRGPTFGPSDILHILVVAFAVYTLIMFRRLINERYDYHGVDILITFAIFWNILFILCSLTLSGLIIAVWPVSEIAMTVIYITYLVVAMVSIGIIDIMIAVRLLQIQDTSSDLIKVFAYINMVAGICEVSVILSPISLLLFPVYCITMAVIFFNAKKEAEFV